MAVIEKRIVRIEAQVEELLCKKRDYEFEIGRALVGKSVGPACRSENPDVVCDDCDCWKHTRGICT